MATSSFSRDDGLKLGFGELSAKSIERVLARCAFFSATRRICAAELGLLRHDCLPLYVEAKRRGGPWHKQHYCPVVTLVSSRPGFEERRLLPIDSFASLEEGAEQLPFLQGLAESLLGWAQRHRLTDRWLLDATLRNLGDWSTKESCGEALRWQYPCCYGTVQDSGRVVVSGIGVEILAGPDLAVQPPVYFPATETRATYLSRVRLYCEITENVVEGQGFKPSRKKRNSKHLDWLVRYQIQNWSHRKIADHHGAKQTLTETAIGKALHQTADLIGITLRSPHKGGRRPSGSLR